MKSVLRIFLAALVGLLLARGAPAPAADSPSAPPAVVQPETHVIQVGDRLSYRVLEDREETRILPVTASGEIEVPYLGKALVAGKTVAAASRDLKAQLEKDLYFKATVLLSVEELAPKPFEMPHTGRTRQISVVGQVRSQGVQDMPRDEKYMLSRAIIKADGFSSFANGRKVQVVRKDAEGKSVKLTADVLSVLKDGKMENDVELLPDDMVIVPEKLINF